MIFHVSTTTPFSKGDEEETRSTNGLGRPVKSACLHKTAMCPTTRPNHPPHPHPMWPCTWSPRAGGSHHLHVAGVVGRLPAGRSRLPGEERAASCHAGERPQRAPAPARAPAAARPAALSLAPPSQHSTPQKTPRRGASGVVAVGQGGRPCVRLGSCPCLDAYGRESSLVFTPYRPPRGGLKKMPCGREEAACATAGAGGSTPPPPAAALYCHTWSPR